MPNVWTHTLIWRYLINIHGSVLAVEFPQVAAGEIKYIFWIRVMNIIGGVYVHPFAPRPNLGSSLMVPAC